MNETHARLAALEAALRGLLDALDAAEGNRGQYSTADPHDGRCPKARAETPDRWRGVWACACGAEDLTAAQRHARAVLGDVPRR